MRQERRSRLVRCALLAGCAFLAAAGVGAQSFRPALAPGERAPDLRGWSPTGERHIAAFDRHKLTLVNFWATWCEPCRDEMPALERLHERHAADGLQIFGVLIDSVSNQEAQAFVEALGVSYPIVRPDENVNRNWGGIGVMPTSFLVDEAGVVVRRYVGATREQIEGLTYDVEAALEGRALGPVIVPEKPAAVTDEDRRRLLEAARKAAEEPPGDGDRP